MSDRIFLVGGGPSLAGFDFTRLSQERTVAVNAAIFNIPECSYFITMDHTFLRKMVGKARQFQKSAKSKVFVVGMHHPFMREIRGAFVDTRFRHTYHLAAFDTIVKSRNKYGCGFDWSSFRNGENSGHCALQLAVLLGFKHIYLLGFDMCVSMRRTHYHQCYRRQQDFESKLERYLVHMKTALDDVETKSDIRVYSCSPYSKLNQWIEYVPWEDVLPCKSL